jgi:hypothetical protein
MTQSCGYQQITVLSAAVGLTVPAAGVVPASQQKPTSARIIPQTQAVRWRDDGTAPTATVGQPLAVGSELIYSGDLNKIQFIEQTASAALNITYFY